eukprot:TRINITY_DN928_c0_g1_i1.p1 TRINITY_DN928_c0_g1~~TRINITY_DN928_c0_g1_i1.p1  ORF type:complete len:1421 (+),score=519.91 TRINITY_DN928_c0_g1_i1:107-4369(+)
MAPLRLVAAAALLGLVASATPGADGGCPMEMLSSLSRNVTWELPLLNITPVPTLGGTLLLNHTRVGGLSACKLGISSSGGAPADEAVVDIDVEALTLNLTSHAALSGGAEGSGDVSLNASVNLKLGTVFESPDLATIAPTNVTVTSCNISFDLFQLKCTGQLEFICGIVTPALVAQMGCGMLQKPGDGNGTVQKLLRNISHLLEEYDAAPPPAEPPSKSEAHLMPDAAKLFNFTDKPAVAAARAIVNDVYGAPGKTAPLVIDEVLEQYWSELLPGAVGSITLPLGAFGDVYNGEVAGMIAANISVINVTVSGLDTINELDMLEVIGNFSTNNTIGFGELGIDVWAKVSLGPTAEVVQADDTVPVVEYVRLNVTLTGLEINMTALVAAQKETMGNTQIGGLLRATLGCILKPLQEVSLPAFLLSAKKISLEVPEVVVTQPALGHDKGTAALLSSLTKTAILLYGPEIAAALPYISQVKLRPLLSTAIGLLLTIETSDRGACAVPCQTELKKECAQKRVLGPTFCHVCLQTNSKKLDAAGCNPDDTAVWCDGKPFPDPQPINFNTSKDVGLASWLVNDFVGVGSDRDINAMLSALGKSQSGVPGVLELKGELIRKELQEVAGIDLGSLALSAGDVRITGADTVSKMDLLQTSGAAPHELNNTMQWAGSLNTSLRMTLNWTDTDGDVLKDDLHVSFVADGVTAGPDLLAAVLDAPFAGLSLRDLEDSDCILSAMDKAPGSLRMLALQLNLTSASLGIQCGPDCTSPGLKGLPAFLQTDACKDEVTQFARQVIAALEKESRDPAVATAIDNRVATADCPSDRPGPTPVPTEKDTAPQADRAFILLVTIPISLTCLWMIYKVITGIRNAKEEELERNDRLQNHALFHHAVVPPVARVLIPLGIISSTAGFLVACTTPGIKSGVKVTIAGQQMYIEDVFDLGLSDSVEKLWQAQVYFFAIVTALASGAWPYVRGSLLMFAWFMPVHILSHKTRHRILWVMDFAGKWSMVNIFVFINLVVSFHLKLRSPDRLSCFPGGFGIVELTIVPQVGFFCMLYGVVAGLAANRMQLVYQRNSEVHCDEAKQTAGARSVADDSDDGLKSPGRVSKVSVRSRASRAWSQAESSASYFMRAADDPHKEALIQHRLLITEDTPLATRLISSTFAKALSCALLLCSMALTIAGAVIITFEFEFHGLPRLALEAIEEGSSKSNYGIFTIASAMMSESTGLGGLNGHIMYGLVVFFFVLFAVIIPLLQLIFLGVAWLVPLQLRQTKIVVFFAGLLAAGSAVEVFIVSLFASLSQISQFAVFLVNDKCHALIPVFEALIRFDILDSNSAQCFDVHATLKPGFGVLLTGAVMYNIAYLMLLYTSELVIAERERGWGHGGSPQSGGPTRPSRRSSRIGADIITIQYASDGVSTEGWEGRRPEP